MHEDILNTRYFNVYLLSTVLKVCVLWLLQ